MKRIVLMLWLCTSATAFGAYQPGDYLIQVTPQLKAALVELQSELPEQTRLEDLEVSGWVRLQVPEQKLSEFNLGQIKNHPDVLHIQPNYRIRLLDDYKLKDEQLRQKLGRLMKTTDENCPIPIPGFCDPDDGGGGGGGGSDPDCPFPIPIPGLCDDPGDGGGGGSPGDGVYTDNPDIPNNGSGGSGADPLFDNQWGMKDIGVKNAWKAQSTKASIVVAVIDTGVDYTHEDLVDNLWRNPGETGQDSQGRDKATNGVDDDGNGFVDDTIGWDFVSNDSKPYDLAVPPEQLMFGGGNPGHGTHCAGNVAAKANNGKGVVGVAPNVKIMAIRFLGEKGQGTTADAVKSVKYAVENGARVLSNSWGSEGEDANDPENKALKDAIRYAETEGRLFVAAAGNGHNGAGYDNDTDSRPGYPASYDMDIIVSVAALDISNNLGSFSNWGARTVDIGAPGVKIFSTTVGSQYADKVADFFGQTVYWDGTSMATPHVAGAAALYWSQNPNKTWRQVKDALLDSAQRISSMRNKSVSQGKLDVEAMMKH